MIATDLERRIADFYDSEAPSRAPDWVLRSALGAIDATPQRRVPVRVRWRLPVISRRAWLLLAAVLVAVLAASAAYLGARLVDDLRWPIARVVSGTFEATGNLVRARSTHTAVLLQDGRVLVIGGDRFDVGWFIPAEMYDPRTGGFSTIEDRGLARGPSSRDGFSATELADGRVLVAGGWDEESSGDLPWRYKREAVLFDPRSSMTTPTGPLNVGRMGHVATRLADGRVLIVGGTSMMLTDGEQVLASAELYDPLTGTFSPTGPMACPRSAFGMYDSDLSATVLPSGRVLVTGGEDGPSCPDDEIYDPATGTLASVRAVGPEEAVSTVILAKPGKVYRYDLQSGTATDITPRSAEVERQVGPNCRDLPVDCRGLMTTTLLADGRVLLAGGFETMPTPGSGNGWQTIARSDGELLDPGSESVQATGALVQPRRAHSATLLADGRVLLIGGEPPVGRPSSLFSSAEIFTPE